MRAIALMLLGASLAQGAEPAKPVTAPALKAGVLSPVMAAPPLALQGTDGKPVELARFKGKVVLVNVWASWCPPCIKEQPDLNAAAAALRGDVQFLGLNIRDASQDDAAAYVRDLEVPYSSIYSADGSALLPFAGTLTPRSIPSTVVLDAEGRVAASVNGRIPTTQTLVSLVEAVRDE